LIFLLLRLKEEVGYQIYTNMTDFTCESVSGGLYGLWL